jgi:hypothetical protein
LKKLVRIASILIVAHLAGSALAQQNTSLEAGIGTDMSKAKGNVLRLQFGPYTHHFTYDSEHSDVVMIGLEREHPDTRLDGITFFTNSFGQPTVYVYPWGGVYPEFGGIQHLSFKWTAGLMYGYKDPYKKKVPLNYNGLSPVVIPALAYEFKPGWSGQLNLLGTAAMMFQLNVTLN